jgi:hypothetical protein
MFKTCYIFVIACLCFGFIIWGILFALFLLCTRTILVLCIVFFYLFHIWLSNFLFIYETNMFVYMYVCMNVCAYICFNTSFLGSEFGGTNQNWQTPKYGYCLSRMVTIWEPWRQVCETRERKELKICRHILTCVNTLYDGHQLSNNRRENLQAYSAFLVFFS